MKSARAQRLALLFSFVLVSGCARSARSADPAHSSGPPFAEKIQLDGVSYVGKINDFLYRGSQPNEQGIQQLKKIGVTTIVDLRGERQGTVATERKRAEALGMRLVIFAPVVGLPQRTRACSILHSSSKAAKRNGLCPLLAWQRPYGRLRSRIPHRL